MKVGIITFHASDNCGSMLQAYALQTTLEKRYGHDVEIIDFSSKGQRQMYALWDTKLRPRILKANIKSLPYWKTIRKMKKDYRDFKTQYFKLTDKQYRKNQELFELDGKYDLVIAGGDQVWNVRCRDTDKAYFLNFISQGIKAAYSPSLGAVDINRFVSNPKEYKDLLMEFDFLSVREPNGKKWLNKLTGKDIPIVADPTLLLTSHAWCEQMKLNEPPIDGKYIFYYAFSYANSALNQRLDKIAKELDMKVFVIERKAWSVCKLSKYGIQLYEQSGPLAFLTMIKYASAVVTDSFHGTLFAALFNKPFCNCRHRVEMDPDDDRSAALLHQLGLENHYVLGEEISTKDIDFEVDYTEANRKIAKLREDAFNYLDGFAKGKKSD